MALTNGDFLQVGQPGASPWLGGIDIDDFGGDLVAATASFGADAISPVHGMPQNGKVSDPGYVPYTTAELVRRCARGRHRGRAVDDRRRGHHGVARSTPGVDGIITNYPDRLRDLLAERGYKLPKGESAPRGTDCVAEVSAVGG